MAEIAGLEEIRLCPRISQCLIGRWKVCKPCVSISEDHNAAARSSTTPAL